MNIIVTVVPVRNDEERIDAIVNNAFQFTDKLIFFENGSIDGTVAKIRFHCHKNNDIELVRLHHDFVITYGFDGLKRLLFNYERKNFDWVIMMDADMICIEPQKLREYLTSLPNRYTALIPKWIDYTTDKQGIYRYILRSGYGKNRLDALGYIHAEPYVNKKNIVHAHTSKKIKDVFFVHKQSTWKDDFFQMLRKTQKSYMQYLVYSKPQLRRGTNKNWYNPKMHDFSKIGNEHDLYINKYYPKSFSMWLNQLKSNNEIFILDNTRGI